MPITPSIIKQIHALATMDNMPKGMKIQNRTGNTIFDSSRTAGVDYIEQANKNDDDSTNDDSTTMSNESAAYDELDVNEIAEILQESPAQSAGVTKDDNEIVVTNDNNEIFNDTFNENESEILNENNENENDILNENNSVSSMIENESIVLSDDSNGNNNNYITNEASDKDMSQYGYDDRYLV